MQAIGALICERDPVRARERDARLLAEAHGVVTPTPRQDVLPRLECGALGASVCSARGTLFPQPWLEPLEPSLGADANRAPPVRMDDRVGPGWWLVLADLDGLVEPPPGIPALQVLRLAELHEAHGVLAAWFERHACGAALVRPDHYVFGTARSPAQLAALLGEARALFEPAVV